MTTEASIVGLLKVDNIVQMTNLFEIDFLIKISRVKSKLGFELSHWGYVHKFNYYFYCCHPFLKVLSLIFKYCITFIIASIPIIL